jgi:hypothetical protein
MEKKGEHFGILKSNDIGILKEKLCKLKHSGKHLKESLEAQNNMQKTFSRQQNQQSQLSGNVRSLTSGFKKFFTS